MSFCVFAVEGPEAAADQDTTLDGTTDGDSDTQPESGPSDAESCNGNDSPQPEDKNDKENSKVADVPHENDSMSSTVVNSSTENNSQKEMEDPPKEG